MQFLKITSIHGQKGWIWNDNGHSLCFWRYGKIGGTSKLLGNPCVQRHGSVQPYFGVVLWLLLWSMSKAGLFNDNKRRFNFNVVTLQHVAKRQWSEQARKLASYCQIMGRIIFLSFLCQVLICPQVFHLTEKIHMEKIGISKTKNMLLII